MLLYLTPIIGTGKGLNRDGLDILSLAAKDLGTNGICPSAHYGNAPGGEI